MLNIETVTQTVKRIVEKKGYTLEVRKSTSTDSWYYKIYCGEYSLMFRISDHATYKDVITLRLDKVKNQVNLERFINNRCHDLSDRILKEELGI